MSVTFTASFPPIQSAIKIGTDGMRLQLEVPESELAKAIEVLAWRECALTVTIEPIVQNTMEQDHGEEPLATRRVGKSAWKASKKPRPNSDT